MSYYPPPPSAPWPERPYSRSDSLQDAIAFLEGQETNADWLLTVANRLYIYATAPEPREDPPF